MKKIKGRSIAGIIIVILLIIIIAAAIFFFGKELGFGSGNGSYGDKSGEEDEAIEVAATVLTTETVTLSETVTVNETVYVDVTVSENKYIFNNATYEIEDIDSLITDIKSVSEDLTVRITDEYASEKAYDNLKSKLQEHDIPITEE